MVTREYDGLAGAGGVKDVSRQLAEALVAHGDVAVTVVLPKYGFMDAQRLGFSPLQFCAPGSSGFGDVFAVDMNYTREERREDVSAWCATIKGVRIILLESLRFTEKRDVYTYTSQEQAVEGWKRRGSGHFDYFAMNILLQKAALDLMILLGERPSIIHCQDGHTAVLAAMIRETSGYRHYFRASGVVVTIHNAGQGYHQEIGDLPFAQAVTGLPGRVIYDSRLGDEFDPFVAASGYAVLNTVSENYARELQETNGDYRTGWLGHKLLQRGIHLAGVTNGINPEDVDPTHSEELGLAASFDPGAGDLEGKKRCKAEVLRLIADGGPWDKVTQFGTLEGSLDQPLFTFIGRFTEQKGVDVLLRSLVRLQAEGHAYRCLVLGSGDPELEEQLLGITEKGSQYGSVCFLRGYDPKLSFKVYAAGDFFLIPSSYEPCGLTDYIAQLLGNLPVVHSVGGLVKVRDGETGLAYSDHSPGSLTDAMCRAINLYENHPQDIRKMQAEAVRTIHRHHTWKVVVKKYFHLYQEALKLTGGNCMEKDT
ncbi:MAG: glycogen synthase [Desulfobulbus propionicus]|nr:MAG: glycogen synthase [Desulfobulbus propionicus]